MKTRRAARFSFYVLALGATGLAAGLVGNFFTLVLTGVEHLAFGLTTGTFAEAITRASPMHRFLVVAATGLLVAALWFVIRRRGPRIPSISEIHAGQRVTIPWMTADTTLQVVNVAAGGSIGREGAPRQLSALFAAKTAARLGLSDESCRILIASGAGAGLAAIYNVPFGGTVFAIEVITGLRALRQGFWHTLQLLVSTLAVCWLATLAARLTVPDRPTYAVDWEKIDTPLWLAALLLGLVAGGGGHAFARMMDRVAAKAPQGPAILWTMPLCYLPLAALAVPLPLVLGNGHAMAQDLFDQKVSLGTVALLIIAKPVATLLTVRAGATGGRLTPSLATGAAIGVVLALLGASFWPFPTTALAILGAAAFLGGSMGTPLTAGVLALEFTGAGPALWGPAALSVGAAWLVTLSLTRK